MNPSKDIKPYFKRIAAVASGIAAVALLLSAFTAIGGDTESAGTETVYRETEVARGDITVGVTETATATLRLHSLSFEVGAELEEIFVKAGQSVKEGDPIATLKTDAIQEQLSELNADYQEAALAVSEAQLARQEGELTAKSKYYSALNNSASADGNYEITVEKLEIAVTTAEQEITELEETLEWLDHIEQYVDGYETYYDNYSSAKQSYESAKSKVNEINEEIRTLIWANGEYYRDSDEYDELASDLEYAKIQQNLANAQYLRAKDIFETDYDEKYPDQESIDTARKEAKQQLEETRLSLKEAQLALENNDADQARGETIEKGDIADATYEMEISQLQNKVASKQLALQNIQDEISKMKGYLENTTITAPCDGLVTAINYSAGDEVQAGAVIATVSDSSQVSVMIAVTQDDISGVSLGQECSVVMDAFEELDFTGVVDSITTSSVRNASGSASYTVTILLQGGTDQVYEGMTGSATLITRQQKDVIYVSSRAVYARDEKQYVKVKGDGGEAVEVEVTTGFSDGRNVEVVSGLEEGQIALIESRVQAR